MPPQARISKVLANGQALEHFARMVAALGGPADFVDHAARHLPTAPVKRPLLARKAGWIRSLATRELGLACIELGGGRHKADDAVDPRVGFTQVVAPGERVEAGGVLALVHAASESSAEMVCKLLSDAFVVGDEPPQQSPILVARVGGRS